MKWYRDAGKGDVRITGSSGVVEWFPTQSMTVSELASFPGSGGIATPPAPGNEASQSTLVNPKT